ncbi:hypothetical protein [Sphingomonas sp. PAMC 26621]|uniref:hypothetical protein n=1 Tax=Sphingomonas sp. PAMC 26621 TaxID=1112213 RepID=UPI000288C27E|nr:hypothetical protein [Sphingomonas sp. PAMC 26621]
MSAILAALAMGQAEFRPLGNCPLIRPVTFFEDMNALPAEIRSDIVKRAGVIYPRTEKGATFSDVLGPKSKVGKVLIYVARDNNQWLASYMYGGIAVRTVTVSYIQSESTTTTTPYLIGALEGDGCTVANAFLKGVSVNMGWQR